MQSKIPPAFSFDYCVDLSHKKNDEEDFYGTKTA